MSPAFLAGLCVGLAMAAVLVAAAGLLAVRWAGRLFMNWIVRALP